MLRSFNAKSLFTLYFALVRPCLIQAHIKMSTGIGDAEKYSIAYVTVPNIEVAKMLGYGLVQNKLAACVNIVPQIISIYQWKEETNEDNELLLMIKTRTTAIDRLSEYVRSNHPYEVCEVISVPIQNGNPPYLKWIGEQVPEKH